ncbi:hypothetical protein AD2_01669 [Acetivibrio thermocellus AD2]|nr:hypothetical protein AD2_01669 [Acetivibrio thermocellus AD2]ANV76411.1 hypothetical protein LQRI_1670 [Acetivibrio thermocellus DSM 2360]EIC05301.1 hypothetical protein YSBL_0978 [Acetivibrio thermocellus YS]
MGLYRTYEELKLLDAIRRGALDFGLYRTYEELKHNDIYGTVVVIDEFVSYL